MPRPDQSKGHCHKEKKGSPTLWTRLRHSLALFILRRSASKPLTAAAAGSVPYRAMVRNHHQYAASAAKERCQRRGRWPRAIAKPSCVPAPIRNTSAPIAIPLICSGHIDRSGPCAVGRFRGRPRLRRSATGSAAARRNEGPARPSVRVAPRATTRGVDPRPRRGTSAPAASSLRSWPPAPGFALEGYRAANRAALCSIDGPSASEWRPNL